MIVAEHDETGDVTSGAHRVTEVPVAQERAPRRAVPLGLAGLLLVAALVMVLDLVGYRDGAGGDPGPATVPLLLAVLCAICGVALIIQTLRGAHDDPDDDGRGVLTWRILGAVVLIAVVGYLLEQIGFFVVFTGMMFGAGLLAGSRNWWRSLVLAIVATWIVMLVFGRLFSVPLPAGPLDRLLGG